MSRLTDPSDNWVSVTPSDTDSLGVVRGLYIGGAGDVAIRGPRMNAPVTLTGVAAGTILPVQARYVYATGTTASGIVALF